MLMELQTIPLVGKTPGVRYRIPEIWYILVVVEFDQGLLAPEYVPNRSNVQGGFGGLRNPLRESLLG